MKQQSCRTCEADFTPAKKSQRYCVECQVCSVEGCGKPRAKKSYCNMHYDRLLATGDVGGPLSSIVENGGPCVVDGCAEVAVAAGKCNMHYKRLRRTGEDGGAQRFRARVGSGLDRKGYRVVYIAGRQHKEHRLVMEKVLGRPLKPSENVHHIDGDRANNDPSNLELWVVNQPTGQRAVDKVRAAIKTLMDYSELASQEGFRLALENQEDLYVIWGLEDNPGKSPMTV